MVSSFPQPLIHGGRLDEAAKRWGIPRERWLDLSTGINPQGWPVPPLPAACWQRLPEDSDGLVQQILDWSGAGPGADCVPVAGSQAAIQSLPLLRAPCRVGVPVPGYQEHACHWARAGHEVVPVSLQAVSDGQQDVLAGLDVLVWIHPGNPSGLTLPVSVLLDWHRRLSARGGWLVVDEAFADGQPGISLTPATGVPGLVVLRSLGKFFGLAGVRAGAVLAPQDIAGALRNQLGPWAVSGPARYVMARALADLRWQSEAAGRLRRESERLDQLLAHHGLAGSTGTLLFRYLEHPGAQTLADALARQGVLVRCFESPAALRFGLPGCESEWQRLDTVLQQVTNVVDHPQPHC